MPHLLDFVRLAIPLVPISLFACLAWVALRASRQWHETRVRPPLAAWEARHVGRLHLDGRWQASGSPVARSIEAFVYGAPAPEKNRRPLPVGYFAHHSFALGPWVLDSISRLETTTSAIELHARHYWDWPWQFAPQMRTWRVYENGRFLGLLRKEVGALVATDAAGRVAGRWQTPVAPGQWHERQTGQNPPGPLFTALTIGTGNLNLRLPVYDFRTNKSDFAGTPFLRDGGKPGVSWPWLSAFLAVAVHASLTLQNRSAFVRSPPRGEVLDVSSRKTSKM